MIQPHSFLKEFLTDEIDTRYRFDEAIRIDIQSDRNNNRLPFAW